LPDENEEQNVEGYGFLDSLWLHHLPTTNPQVVEESDEKIKPAAPFYRGVETFNFKCNGLHVSIIMYLCSYINMYLLLYVYICFEHVFVTVSLKG